MVDAPDLRSSPRVPISEFIVRVGENRHRVRGNVSSGGVGFLLNEPLAVGQVIRVELELPDGQGFELDAGIRHVRPAEQGGLSYGAVFLDVDALSQNPLERFIEEESLRASIPPLTSDLLR